jgi:hypothetical protein
MQANIFPLKEFDDWEAITPKTYPALKIFIGRAYLRCILAQQLCNTAGQMGYTRMKQNMYASLGDNDDDDMTATDNTIMNMAALTTGSSITAANTVHELVINAINQLNANQAALVQQMAAMPLTNHNRTLPPAQNHDASSANATTHNPNAGTIRGRRDTVYIQRGTRRTRWTWRTNWTR